MMAAMNTREGRLGHRRQNGFTLMELMIAVAIVGILAAIAYPSYVDIVVGNNRAVAHSALAELVSQQESYFIQNQKYANNVRDLGFPSSPIGLRNNGGYIDLDKKSSNDAIYELQVSPGDPFSGDYNFKVEAVPANIQTRDSGCGTLFITASGKRGATGSGDDCW